MDSLPADDAFVGPPATAPASPGPSDAVPAPPMPGEQAQIGNPASVNCVEQGGTVEVLVGPDGEQGTCILPDGRQVDEWELYRSDASAQPDQAQ